MTEICTSVLLQFITRYASFYSVGSFMKFSLNNLACLPVSNKTSGSKAKIPAVFLFKDPITDSGFQLAFQQVYSVPHPVHDKFASILTSVCSCRCDQHRLKKLQMTQPTNLRKMKLLYFFIFIALSLLIYHFCVNSPTEENMTSTTEKLDFSMKIRLTQF